MSSSSTPAAPATPVASNQSLANTSNYVQEAQQVMQADRKASQSILWSAVNAAGFAVLLYDLTVERCEARSLVLEYLEMTFLLIFLLNVVYHLTTYFVLFFTFRPVPLSDKQKQLLGVKKTDPRFPPLTPKVTPDQDRQQLEQRTPLNLSAASWLNSSLLSSASSTAGSSQSPFLPSSSLANASSSSWNNASFSPSWQNPSPNVSLSSSWVYQRGSPPPSSTPTHLPQWDEPIADEASLSSYLRQCDDFDKKQSNNSPNLNSSPSNLSLLWSSSVNAVPELPVIATYHLAPVSPPQEAGSSRTLGEDGASTTVSVNVEMWHREGVSIECLSRWNKNLRQWLTATVLSTVCKEIEAVNVSLQRLGLSDDRVGGCGLERLKKTAQMAQVAQNVPSLAALVPFLEVTQHQEYLVQRIRELAQGGCMSNFRWNSGGTFKGKPWEEHLPTDSALVLHLLASYLDVTLPPMLHRPDWRPFSAQFLSKDKLPRLEEDSVLIHQARVNPPHYVLYWKKDVLEVAQGCNNLIHTLLLFLHRLREHQDGMLGRMSLGPSGLNILWVMES